MTNNKIELVINKFHNTKKNHEPSEIPSMHTSLTSSPHLPAKNVIILEKCTKERQPIFKIYDIFWLKIHAQKIPENLAFLWIEAKVKAMVQK